jgi:arylsulfatase A-like enzyme/Tfp pilus assembly protein PilF
MRRPFLSVLLLAFGSLTSLAKPVNIILITLDTTRADRMGFLGSKLGLTQNLDSLAQHATVFTRAYCQVPLTTPSHAAILTGTYPQFNHVSDLGSPLPEDLAYLPDILHKRGYRTAAFVGSQVLDPKSATAPGFDRGFDTYDAPFHLRGEGEDRYQSVERRGIMVVNSALAWLKEHPDGPFFVWLHFYDPHDPYDPEPPFKSRYASSPYNGEIAYVDSVLGKFFAELKKRGLYDQVLITVVADHGEALGEHGEQSHGLFLYDETIHVPLVIKLPGASAHHSLIQTRVGLVDVAPTLLQEAGVVAPGTMQGKSLIELMTPRAVAAAKTSKSDSAARDRPQYAETDYPYRAFGWSSLRSWREGKYLYIDAPRSELYDQSLDAAASHNLVNNVPAISATMAEQLAAFRSRTSSSDKTPNSITPLQAQQLQALGYISSGSTKQESEEKHRGADPKDKVQIANILHQALLQMDDEHYREAVPLLEQVLKADPSMAVANLQLGRALNRLDHYAEAIPWLRKAVELTPRSADAHFELGSALQEMGDSKATVEQFEAAVSQNPSSDELRFRLGAAYEEMDRVDDAMKQYSDALSLNPDNFRANLFLGRRLAMQDRPKEALPLLQRAVQLEPQSADAHKFLGNVYTVLGEAEKARAEQNEVQRLNVIPHP